MSKPKSNSIIDGLPAAQREQIEAWLFEENLSYNEVAEKLRLDGVRCSVRALSEFYQRQAQERMLDRIASARSSANAVRKQFSDNPADMYQALVDMVGQFAFEASMDGKKFDPELIFNFTKLVMTARKQELESQTLTLQRDKFQFDATKAAMAQLPALRKIASNNALSETDKLTQARQLLFGELPA